MESFITEIPNLSRQADEVFSNTIIKYPDQFGAIAQTELVQAGGILLPTDVNEAYKSLLAFVYSRKGENLKAVSGFISKYRLVESLCNIVKIDNTMDISTQQLFKQAQNPEEFNKIAQNREAFIKLEAAINNQPSTQFTTTNQAFYSYKTTSIHPYYTRGTTLFSIPNYPSTDPRRSGKLIVFTELSDELFVFLLLNAASYGFVWYGIDKSYWIYEGDVVIKKANQIKLAIQKLITQGVNVFTDIYN
jgi:hypothetical protein